MEKISGRNHWGWRNKNIQILSFCAHAKAESRILKCNEDCTQITWSKGVDEKTSKLDFAQIVEVRAGAGDITPFEESESGTATLRRCAKPDDMMRCFSLITKSRTIDFMCLSATDFEVLFSRFKGACLEANGVRYRWVLWNYPGSPYQSLKMPHLISICIGIHAITGGWINFTDYVDGSPLGGEGSF